MAVESTPRRRIDARIRHRLSSGLLALLLAFSAGLFIHPLAQALPPVVVNTSVQSRFINNSVGLLGGVGLGANVPQYVDGFRDSKTTSRIAQADIHALRYPGGSNADYYDWYKNGLPTKSDGSLNMDPNYYQNAAVGSTPVSPLWPFQPYASPNLDFDTFMNEVTSTNAQADITVNYGEYATNVFQGASVAAAWVGYANKNYTSAQLQAYGVTTQYANANPNGHAYNIKNWEIGNEVYGDGYYASKRNPNTGQPLDMNWEYVQTLNNNYSQATLSPANYGQAVIEYSAFMKVVDPTIRVGAVLTMPTNYPDDLSFRSLPAGTLPWNKTVLDTSLGGTDTVCNAIDFVAVHWYAQQPGFESDATLLAAPKNGVSGNTAGIPAMMTLLRNELTRECGVARGNAIGIRVTEANSVNSRPGKQTVGLVNSMFLEDTIMTFLENGAEAVDWWSLHNGFYQPINTVVGGAGYPANGPVYTPAGNNSSSLYPLGNNIRYGDFGLLSNGPGSPPKANQGQLLNGSYYPATGSPPKPNVINTPVAEPPVNTPFVSFYGMQMTAILIGDVGGSYTATSSTNSLIIVHAMLEQVPFQRPFLAVMVINEDSSSQSVMINLPAGRSASGATISWFFQTGNAAPGFKTTSIAAGATSFVLPSVGVYSTNILQIPL